jgi:hypothetical protein
MAQSICFGGLGRNGGTSQLGQSRRFGRGPPLPVYPQFRTSTDRPRWSGSCQFGRLVSEPHSFIETNKQREKTNKQNPDREDVSKRYFHTRFACMQIGSRSSWGCRQDCR